jgi:cytochrome P450
MAATTTTTTTASGAQATKPAASRLPPGPPPRRGIVRTLRYYAAFALDPIGFVRNRFATYGDAYYAPNANGGLVVFKHPDHLHEVLSTKASSFTKEHSALAQLSRVLGEGLLTSDGATWTRQRRMIGPAFAPARIAEYGSVMVDEALETVKTWTPSSRRGGQLRSVSDEMAALTLRVVSRALFGHDVAAHDIRTIATAMAAFQRSLSSPDFLPKWMKTPARRRLEEGAAALDKLMYGLIEQRRAAKDDAPRTDLLERLVTAVDTEGKGETLTIREVRDQLVTLFLAGHETTAHTLTWAFYALAKTPDVEKRLHEEIDRVLDGRPPQVADLEKLPYVEQVVNETLRMYPPVYGIGRRASEDVSIGEFHVPRGSEVMLWVYLTHHDPRFFPNPERFEPERFARDRIASIPKFAFVPFGGGPRACIGKSFAMLEARLLLATIAQRYRLTLPKNARVEVAPRITLTPKRTLKMLVSPR